MTYILDEHGEPQAVDICTWASWIVTSRNRIVRQTTVCPSYWHWLRRRPLVLVSTVFLGLDYRPFPGVGCPVLWETMVVRGRHDQWQQRYTNLIAAEGGHWMIVRYVARWGWIVSGGHDA